jgi:hypothetical protein
MEVPLLEVLRNIFVEEILGVRYESVLGGTPKKAYRSIDAIYRTNRAVQSF